MDVKMNPYAKEHPELVRALIREGKLAGQTSGILALRRDAAGGGDGGKTFSCHYARTGTYVYYGYKKQRTEKLIVK